MTYNITVVIILRSALFSDFFVILYGSNLDINTRFDAQSLCVFVGDYSGQISVLKISRTSFELLTVLKGHTGIATHLV